MQLVSRGRGLEETKVKNGRQSRRRSRENNGEREIFGKPKHQVSKYEHLLVMEVQMRNMGVEEWAKLFALTGSDKKATREEKIV